MSDFNIYARLERAGKPFDYVLITNEFDPARLVAACERQTRGRPLFATVVHVNPTGLLAAYGDKLRYSAKKVHLLIYKKRLVSFEAWLTGLLDSAPS